MAERRKIIIPIRQNPDEPLPAPHFDAEATQTAQRVVPLSDEEARLLHQGQYSVRVQKPFWKRPLVIALVVMVAAGLGVAAGFAIGMYRNRKPPQTPAVNAQPSTAESTNQVAEQPTPVASPQAPRASVSEKPQETPAPAEPKTEERSPAARNETKNSNEEETPAAASGKKRTGKDVDDNTPAADEQQAERERRRESRRAERRRQQDEENPVDLPRQMDRARQQVNRIREIFEGRQP